MPSCAVIGCAVIGCAVLLWNVGKKPEDGLNCNVILQECLKIGEKQADENKVWSIEKETKENPW